MMNINGVYVLGLVQAINIATLDMASHLDSPNVSSICSYKAFGFIGKWFLASCTLIIK
jgi:hypothetical protein